MWATWSTTGSSAIAAHPRSTSSLNGRAVTASLFAYQITASPQRTLIVWLPQIQQPRIQSTPRRRPAPSRPVENPAQWCSPGRHQFDETKATRA